MYGQEILKKLNAMKDNWFGSTLETPGTPMIDSGTGRPLILRTFEFAMKPLPPGTPHPTKQQLFNAHWEQIKITIRFDGLVANTDVEPRVVIGKKRYRIFILCEPKFRELIIEQPKTLQQIFKPRQKK